MNDIRTLKQMLIDEDPSNVQIAKNIILNSWDELKTEFKKYFPTKKSVKEFKYKACNAIDTYTLFRTSKRGKHGRVPYTCFQHTNFDFRIPINFGLYPTPQFRYEIHVPKQPVSVVKHIKKMLGEVGVEKYFHFRAAIKNPLKEGKVLPLNDILCLYCKYIAMIDMLSNNTEKIVTENTNIVYSLNIELPVDYDTISFSDSYEQFNNLFKTAITFTYLNVNTHITINVNSLKNGIPLFYRFDASAIKRVDTILHDKLLKVSIEELASIVMQDFTHIQQQIF